MLATLPRKTTLALGTFVLLAALLPPALLPHGVRPARILSAFVLIHPAPALPAPEIAQPAPAMARLPAPETSQYLAVPAGSLDTFYAALHRTEAKEPGAITRILHYGDSPTTADSITSDIRRLFQARFGDAGHGFVLIAKPWAWYGHSGIKLDAKGWHIQPASQGRAPDGIHGLGGVSFIGEPGARSRVTLPDGHYSRATVYYLAQPGGGDFFVGSANPGGAPNLDTKTRDTNTRDTKITDVNTAADDKALAFAEFALPPETGTIELGVSAGKVRLFGYRFDKDQPGVQYNSLGINGVQVQMIVRYFETEQWKAALRHEDPALVILNYGTNESIYPSYVEKQYPDELRLVIARVREALPRASILLMGPMDRGVMTGGEISTPESLTALIEVQKKVAADTGCAFFNTFEAMGGAGTMGRWYRVEPRLVSADFMHPLPAGAAIVGGLFENALVQAYEAAQGK